MPPEIPESSPENNDTRGLLDRLKNWVEGLFEDENKEIKDQLDILFDTKKLKEDRLQSLLYFRNKFFPDGIENGKSTMCQFHRTKRVEKIPHAAL